MARAAKKPTKSKRKPNGRGKAGKAVAKPSIWKRLRRWLGISALGFFALTMLLVTVVAFVNPPTTPYMWSESRRLGAVDFQWVDLEEINPNLARAVIAAEDANFCLHWGFDMREIRKALEDGSGRGASTISQQVVKNVYLWHGRSWLRKALEAGLTPLVEAIWTKRRIVEVYLNVAEFGEGVFGAEAAARNAFGVGPDRLALWQAASLAAVLPDPKGRSATSGSDYMRKRSSSIADGAETIRADGRADCFAAG